MAFLSARTIPRIFHREVRRKRLPEQTVDAAVIGIIGGLLGLPPTAVPVHPTQLYEAIGLGIIGALLLHWRRANVDDRVLVGRYLLLVGALRFVIEFLRVHQPLALGLAPAHWISLGAVAAGAVLIRTQNRTNRPTLTVT